MATQDLAPTTWGALVAPAPLEAVYIGNPSLIDALLSTVSVREVFRTDMVADGQRVQWGIPHFSGYGISTGRKAASPTSP